MTADCSKCGHITIYWRERKFSKEIVCGLVLASPAVKNHELTDICEHSRTAFCKTCGLVNIRHSKSKGTGERSCTGFWYCGKKKLGVKARKQKRHTDVKKTYCEKCGFVAVHSRQLDIHHIDHNHLNDVPENMMTICARCHKLEHFKNLTNPSKEIHHIKKMKKGSRKYFISIKSDTCTKCGFIAEHHSQIEIHHIDGNHDNNELENLTSLCTNCHRLEHSQSKEDIENARISKLLARREACKNTT